MICWCIPGASKAGPQETSVDEPMGQELEHRVARPGTCHALAAGPWASRSCSIVTVKPLRWSRCTETPNKRASVLSAAPPHTRTAAGARRTARGHPCAPSLKRDHQLRTGWHLTLPPRLSLLLLCLGEKTGDRHGNHSPGDPAPTGSHRHLSGCSSESRSRPQTGSSPLPLARAGSFVVIVMTLGPCFWRLTQWVPPWLTTCSPSGFGRVSL